MGLTPAGGTPSSKGGQRGEIVLIAHGGLMPLVYERVTNALGPKRAGEVLREALRQTSDRPVDTPDDMLAFAEAMLAQGGLIEAIGRSLKVQALLRGAVAASPSHR
jgi:hypothetical protein